MVYILTPHDVYSFCALPNFIDIDKYSSQLCNSFYSVYWLIIELFFTNKEILLIILRLSGFISIGLIAALGLKKLLCNFYSRRDHK